ncbi:recombinase family protein [Helicobacter turcicus]|uniref:Recombinase family protein n=1 Tax=Helicobacter turcicus TaxID=2867412 RepID=A0ABS7JPD8_9HELI|nr:recombinase family protein [Helicobacter turcicus]MBX7491228.1 recombinase family protein [Helicobacter turcicus]MBX7546133.1 recombinase family protein [Helicobacter turcicus]
MVVGYVRVSTNHQDLKSQVMEIERYCKENSLLLDKLFKVKTSSSQSQQKRRVSELKAMLKQGDTLIITELSRLGRDMFEVVILILELIKNKVNLVFTKQKELNDLSYVTTKLLLILHAFFAENEKEMIKKRSYAGLLKARENGKILGRPFGTKNSYFDRYEAKIIREIKKGNSLMSIWKKHFKEKSYNSFLYYCKNRKLA